MAGKIRFKAACNETSSIKFYKSKKPHRRHYSTLKDDHGTQEHEAELMIFIANNKSNKNIPV